MPLYVDHTSFKKDLGYVKLQQIKDKTGRFVQVLLCVTCGKSFQRLGKMTNHVKTHTGKQAHACPLCSKLFAESRSLRSHLLKRVCEKQTQKRHDGFSNPKANLLLLDQLKASKNRDYD